MDCLISQLIFWTEKSVVVLKKVSMTLALDFLSQTTKEKYATCTEKALGTIQKEFFWL